MALVAVPGGGLYKAMEDVLPCKGAGVWLQCRMRAKEKDYHVDSGG